MRAHHEIRNCNILLKWLFLVVLSTGFQHFQESRISGLNRIELVGEQQVHRPTGVTFQISLPTWSEGRTNRYPNYKNRQLAILETINQQLTNRTLTLLDSNLSPFIIRPSITCLHFKSRSLTSEDPACFHS